MLRYFGCKKQDENPERHIQEETKKEGIGTPKLRFG